MAERSSGGRVRSDTTSAARTRPCASLRAADSGGNGTAPLSTRASASETDIIALLSAMSASLHLLGGIFSAIVPGLAAAFLDQADGLDTHAALDRLDHVVDGQACDGDRDKRLHLDARWA